MTSTARYLHETHASGPPRAGHIGSAWRWGPSETPSGHPPAPTRRRARSWFGIRYRADPRAGKCRPPARLIEVESSVPSSRCFWARFSSPRGPRKSHSAPRPEACRHGGRPRSRVDRAHPGCETGAERVTVRLSPLGASRERLAFRSARPRCLTSNTLELPRSARLSATPGPSGVMDEKDRVRFTALQRRKLQRFEDIVDDLEDLVTDGSPSSAELEARRVFS